MSHCPCVHADGVRALAQSPDLNLKESLWQQIKREAAKNKPVTKVVLLVEMIVKTWYPLIASERLEIFIKDIPRVARR